MDLTNQINSLRMDKPTKIGFCFEGKSFQIALKRKNAKSGGK